MSKQALDMTTGWAGWNLYLWLWPKQASADSLSFTSGQTRGENETDCANCTDSCCAHNLNGQQYDLDQVNTNKQINKKHTKKQQQEKMYR